MIGVALTFQKRNFDGVFLKEKPASSRQTKAFPGLVQRCRLSCRLNGISSIVALSYRPLHRLDKLFRVCFHAFLERVFFVHALFPTWFQSLLPTAHKEPVRVGN